MPINFSTSTANGMLTPGNIQDLYNRKILQNPDGSYSTTTSMSFGSNENGRQVEILIPTVVDGRRLSPQQAIQYYNQTGQHLGKFDTPENADIYAQMLHESQAVKQPQPILPQRQNIIKSLIRK